VSSYETTLQPAASRDEARVLFGQTMGLVAITTSFFAIGAYLGRDLRRAGPRPVHREFRSAARPQLRRLALRAARNRLPVRLRFPVGLATAPTIAYYAATNPQSVWQAGGATALFIAGFGAFGYATRRDLSGLARVCFWALLALIVFGIVAIFVRIPNSA
jgi:modulator of FtsH protease